MDAILDYESITAIDELRQFCDELSDAPVIAFDTEFVSEDRYRPQLCLIQVAAAGRLAIIDPLKMHTTAPFWDLLVEPGRAILAHAAREETRFCYRYAEKPIVGLFDTQLAAGFCGMEYPISLGNLVNRMTGRTLAKGESRTNWRKRPLSREQIQYALQDVTDLEAIYEQQKETLRELGRADWLDEETQIRQQAVIDYEDQESWHRVSGCAGLKPRQLEIVRQLWRWRDKRASTLDRPARRVMRDDLIVELARRGSADIKRIRSIRGMDWRGYSAHYEDIAAAIEIALETPDDELPRRPRRNRSVISPMLSQFLTTSMACISRQNKLAPSIVGNTDDVKEVLGYELDRKEGDEVPALLQGWRGEIVGKTFRRLLKGEAAIRVADVRQEQPLEFIELD
ncbi:ribonuclease D [Roseiconus lacunae]|uniref:ribonuclease D n=1 Tax=Roseiconus lacunae TaxID=2605694 RepID=UPI001E2885F9|nr:HRDC domain-containing protein [Roseiconus lacunae]MCD0458814.1 HRDC domain-containing protein [Roseiconus lacunae]